MSKTKKLKKIRKTKELKNFEKLVSEDLDFFAKSIKIQGIRSSILKIAEEDFKRSQKTIVV